MIEKTSKKRRYFHTIHVTQTANEKSQRASLWSHSQGMVQPKRPMVEVRAPTVCTPYSRRRCLLRLRRRSAARPRMDPGFRLRFGKQRSCADADGKTHISQHHRRSKRFSQILIPSTRIKRFARRPLHRSRKSSD
jgi:hypothetical protein